MDFHLRQLPAQPTAAVRVQTTTDDLGRQFDIYLPAVMQRLHAIGVEIGGPPFARYHAYGADGVDVEIGFPLIAELSDLRPLASVAAGEVGAGELPAGEAAVAIHRGPYDGLPATYDALHSWLHDQGREDGPGPWESYIDDPGSVEDSSAVRTEVFWPLASRE